MKDSVYFQNQFLDAVEAMVDHAVNNAGYDKTIKANIVECTDAAIGKYTVKYQDIHFDAFAKEVDAKYEAGALVQILIPQNDMRQKKVILDYAEENYLDTEGLPIEIEDYFDKLTGNLVLTNETYGLNSYQANPEHDIILYKKDEINDINFEEEGFADGLNEASGFTLQASFKNLSQQLLGEFGIVCSLNFKNKNNPVEYSFNSNIMSGDPNIFDDFINQSHVFTLSQDDINNFESVEEIRLYARNFAITEAGHQADIFIKDLDIHTVLELTEAQLKAYNVNVTKSAVSFAADAPQTATIEVAAILKRGTNNIDTSSQKYQCYWFKEDASINANSEYYSTYGGIGWKLITQTKEVEGAMNETLFNTFNLITTCAENVAFRNTYKVVITGNNISLGNKIFYIYNNSVDNHLEIISDQGTDFYYNNGNPTLSILQNGQVITGINATYDWVIEDSNGNTIHIDNIHDYFLQADISDMGGNTIRKYICSIKELTGQDEGIDWGSANITLHNYVGEEYLSQYTLNILDKNKTFNYNIYGIAPNNGSVDRPIKLEPLAFELIDAGGKVVNPNLCIIQWSKTNENTLVTIPEGVDTTLPTLDYDLLPKYNPKKIYDNIIDLKVIFEGYTYIDAANFSFVKDGEPGYNGTDIICKIVPNLQNPNSLLEYPTIRNGVLNYNPQNANKWFRAQLWKDGQIIWEGYQSDNKATLNWSILRTSQSASNNVSNITISNNNFSVASGEINNNANNIVEATVIYNDLYYFGTIPVLVSKTTNNYNINLIKDTGYQYVVYSSAGKNPQWDSSIPFEIEVYNGTTDITNNCTYIWSCNTTNLINNAVAASNENDSIVPIDTFIGDIVKNAIIVEAKQNNTSLGKIYIPIHMYLNKYSLTAIKNWDGNSITLDNDEGAILAPQVGAGTKDAQGRFTGVLMGAVKETGSAEPDQGLLGYHEGERTIFLDANTGKAEFGKTGAGQIILDPTQEKALIYSKNYTAGSSGMLIDLTTPEIKWGNNKFKVDSTGKLTATGADIGGKISATSGDIGGWQIDSVQLKKTITDTVNNKNYSIELRSDRGYNEAAILVYNHTDSQYNFYVRGDGYLYARNANITGNITATTGSFTGTITAETGTIGGWTLGEHKIYTTSEGKVAVMQAPTSETTWVFAAGGTSHSSYSDCPFRVSKAGAVTCSNLTVTGGSFSIGGSTSGFSVTTTGKLKAYTANGGYIDMGVSTKNPKVSGLNVGSDGLVLSGAGISTCSGVTHTGNMTISSDKQLNLTGNTSMVLGCGNKGLGYMSFLTSEGSTGFTGLDLYYLVHGSSSRNIKQNINNIDKKELIEIANIIKDMPIYSYYYKKEYNDPTILHHGFIIEDIEKTKLNEYLHFIQDPQDKNLKTYDGGELPKLNLILIKYLLQKIDDLERRLK